MIVNLITTVYIFLWGDLFTIPLPGGGSLGISLLILLLIPIGIYFTIRTRFLPIRLFPDMIRALSEKKNEKSSLSSFQTLIVSTATRVGMGNLVGVVAAVSAGGAGAVFWMWVTAIIGSSTAFIEATLAQLHKEEDPLYGGYRGGPAYYIETAMHKRWLGVLFAFSLIVTYAGGFNLLCSFNMQSTFLVYSFYDPTTTPWIIGAIFAALVAYCLIGGGQRIIKVTSVLVPLMGGIYILAALIVIVFHITSLPQVFAMIFADAFDFQEPLRVFFQYGHGILAKGCDDAVGQGRSHALDGAAAQEAFDAVDRFGDDAAPAVSGELAAIALMLDPVALHFQAVADEGFRPVAGDGIRRIIVFIVQAEDAVIRIGRFK